MMYSDFCSACLVTGVKMHSYLSFSKELVQLFGFPWSSAKHRKASFCYECAAMLRKFDIFKRKCAIAQGVLLQIERNISEVTLMHIQNIDRAHYTLVSSLVQTECVVLTHNDDDDNADVKDFEDNLSGRNITSLTNKTNEETNEVKDELMEEVGTFQNFDNDNDDDGNNDYGDDNNDDGDNNNDDSYYLSDSSESSTDIQDTSKEKHKNRKGESKKYIIESLSDVDDDPFSVEVSKMIEEYQGKEVVKRVEPKRFKIEFFEKYFIVEFLTPETAMRELLLRKETNNYVNCQFKCDLCYRGYETTAAFENHMIKHSKVNGELECETCHLRFSRRRPFGSHILSWHKRKFTCKLCPHIVYCADNARAHIINVHQDKEYPCKDCGEIFSSPDKLLAHKRQRHMPESLCDLCGSPFPTPLELATHCSDLHRYEKNEKLGPFCEECAIHFASTEAWKVHLESSYTHAVMSNGCKHCGELYPSAEELKDHMVVHSKKQQVRKDTIEVPTVCIYCAEYLATLPEYQSHMQAAHPDSDVARKLKGDEPMPFVCETCGHAFKKQYHFDKHQRKHTGERPYKCGRCEKAYTTAATLQAHRAAAHSELVPRRTGKARRYPLRHPCQICNREFSFKSELNKHMRGHSGYRASLNWKHNCGVCQKSFPYAANLRQHVRYVHEEGWPKRDRGKKRREKVKVVLVEEN